MKYPLSIYKVISFPHTHVNADVFIDWAYEMLESGFDTPNLLMLAAVNKPATYYDMEPYMLNAFKELGLKELTESDAQLSVAYFYAYKMSIGEDVKSNLYAFARDLMWSDDGYYSDLLELYWAWDDFQYGDVQYYVSGVTPDNIEIITMCRAKDWLEKYESVALSLLP